MKATVESAQLPRELTTEQRAEDFSRQEIKATTNEGDGEGESQRYDPRSELVIGTRSGRREKMSKNITCESKTNSLWTGP